MASRANNRIAVLVGLLAVLVGILGIAVSWGAYLLDSDIEKHGARAVGNITGKSLASVADGSSDFIVAYWFSLPSGERLEAQHSVSPELWERLREGGTLVVAYSQRNPDRNFPVGAGVTSLGVTVFVSVLSAAFALFGTLLLVSFCRRPGGQI